MAIDSLLGGGAAERAGGSFGEAVARINRVHFNYSQVGEWDAAARRVIPFWTFLSRNVPLQMQEMLLKPRAYAIYNSFVRNFSEGDQSVLPKFITDNAGFRISGGMALMPDIGANQLADSVNKLANPSQLMAQTTPLIKVPAQLMAGKDFYYDQPYKDNDFQRLPTELSPLSPIAGLLGLSQDIPQTSEGGGGTAVERKYIDAAYDLLPPISWLNRLTGSTPDQADKQAQARLSFLGLPVRQLTPKVLESEQRRRKGQAKGAKSDEAARRKALQALARTG